MRTSLFLAVLTVCIFAAVVSGKHSTRKLIATTQSVPRGWERSHEAKPTDAVSFHLLLKNKNQAQLERIFWEVSNPQHENYGKYMTKKEVDDLTRPDQSVFDDIDAWLAPVASKMSIEKHASIIKVKTTAAVAKELFQVPFHWFSYMGTQKRVIRAAGDATIPEHIHNHLDLIAGMSEFITDKVEPMIHRPRTHKKAAAPGDILITPSLVKSYYGIPATLAGSNSASYQGIAAFDDYFSLGALAAFDKNQSIPAPSVTRDGPDCLAENCDQYESDLDVQYLTAIAQNIKTLFIAQGVDYWVLQFCEDVITQLNPAPYVFSISYGWSELRQCDIAVANCPKFGYNSQQYVNRTNFDFQKLGVTGITVLVSDGDDGAPGFGGVSGNCPLDVNTYCPTGGCAHTSTQCNAFTVVNETSGDLCFFPMGLASPGCAGFLNDQNAESALNAFFRAQGSSCAFTLEQDSNQLPHVHANCPCSNIKNVTKFGYTFTQYVFEQANGPVFTADYPTSSPFVTSVGATMFVGTPSAFSEITCTILRGALITTGGGFSAFQDQPDYQQSAVSAYMGMMSGNSEFPPSWSFNSGMRGYPDVAFNGHNYLIFVTSGQTGDKCPCEATRVDGTSASSPALAGMISLINDNLLNNGKPVLGFLNPLLYQASAANPNIFNDIQEGDNRCNRGYCCIYGFPASKGWDPVSGLGSPKFSPLLSYITQMHEARAVRFGLQKNALNN